LQIFSLGIKALTGVMLIIICAMIPSAIILPQNDLTLDVVQLQSSWQIHGLFLASLLCGAEIGAVCSISYLIIGLFYLPVFHGGGSIGYILTPEFGYLLGFIPSAWTCGILAKRESNPNLINYSIYTVISLCILHLTGIFYLIAGKIFGNWINSLLDLILINTIIPFPSQLLLCLTISLIALSLKRFLLIK
tara:strand:- start:5361 stop:5933 length:573 start_codon:yes stop_codon:yes gene_type:complete